MVKNILKVVLISALIFLAPEAAHPYDFKVTSGTASATIQELSRKENKTADDYLTLGWAYYAFNNNIEDGAINLKKALEKDPGLYEADFLLGLLYKSKGEYEKAFSCWLKCLDPGRPESALLIRDILKLDLSIKQIKEVMAKYESLISSPDADELVKSSAFYYLAQEHAVLGDIEKAKENYQKLGLIRDWVVIGSFDNKERTGFDAVYPPETEIDLTKTYDVKGRRVGWRKLIGVSLSQTVNFDSIFYPNEWAVGYALTYIYSEKDQDVAVRVGSDDAVKVWLNDRLIIQNEKYRMFALDQDETGAVLHKGWNKLLVKVCEGYGEWLFGLRITGVNGRPIEALKCSIKPNPYTSDAARLPSSRGNPAINTIKGLLADKIKENPADYLSGYILAEWFRALDLRRECMDEFESLTQKEPHCAIFRFGLATMESIDGEDEKALGDYKETVIENPKHAEALTKIAYHFYDNGMEEQALQYAKMAEDISPDFIENYILTSSIYSEKDRDKDAYDKAKTGLLKYPESIRMLDRAADCASDIFRFDEAIGYYEKILQLDRHLPPSDYAGLVAICILRGDMPKIEDILNKRIEYYPFDSSYYEYLTKLGLLTSNYQNIIAYCDKGLEISPDNYVFYEAKGDAYNYLGKKEEAVREWEKALTLEPGLVKLRDKIRSAGGKENPVFDEYAETEGSIKNLLETNDASERYPDDDAVLLLDKEIYDVHDDGSCEIMAHNVIKVRTKEGIDKFGTIGLPSGHNLQVEKAVVKNPGKTDIEITEIDFDEGHLYPADLKEGSVIEYKYRYDESGGPLKGYFYHTFVFREANPIYKKEVIVIAPKGKKFKTYKKDGNVFYRTESFNDREVYRWQVVYSDPIKVEPFMPDYGELLSITAVSDIPSWDFLADWENNLIDDQLEVDPSIKTQIDQLIKDKTTPEEKAMAIYGYLNNNIHYISLEHGVFGWKPSRATKVFKNQYGDCKDMAVLMMAMLKNAGINAYLVLLFTKPYDIAVTDIPIPAANHAIVYAPGLNGNKGLFFDVTTSTCNYGTIPYWDEGVTAIILKRPGYEIVQIPNSRADDNVTATKADVVLSKKDQSKFKMEIKCYGQVGGKWRSDARKDDWDGQLSSSRYLGRYIQGISSLKNRTENGMDLTKPFTVYAEFSAASPLKEAEEGRYEMAPLFALRSMRDYASLEKRANDLDICYAFTRVTEENLSMPEGFGIVSIPENAKIDNETVSYERSYEFKDNVLRLKSRFSIKKAVIKKEDYPAFRNNLIEIDKLDERHVIFSSK